MLTSANKSQVTEVVSQISVWKKNFASVPEQVEILFLVGDFGGLQKKNCCPGCGNIDKMRLSFFRTR